MASVRLRAPADAERMTGDDPPVLQPDIDRLVQDANLVINYAARVGRLPDSSLVTTLNAVQSAPPDQAPQAASALLVALNDAVRAIAPMTLAELRANLSPFDPKGQRRLKISQIFFSVVTIVLLALVADCSEYLHRQATALRALQQVQEARPFEKLNELRKMVQVDAVLAKRDAIHYDQYHRSIIELRELSSRLAGAYEVVNQVKERGPYVSRLANWAEGRLGVAQPTRATYGRYDAPTVPVQQGDRGESRGAPVASGQKPESKAVTSYEEAAALAAAQSPARSAALDVCGADSDAALSGMKTYPPWVKLVAADLLEEICFSTKLQLMLSEPPRQELFFWMPATMAALSGWILPFLYGLLGASVYVMRNLLDPRAASLGFAPALLRVSLGGIAGIIIGWFSMAPGTKGVDIQSISLIPFGLAFCAGFSIELLFSVLDRINRAITDQPAPQRTT